MFKMVKNKLLKLTVFEVFISISIVVFAVFIVKFFGLKVEHKIIRIEVINKSWGENYNPYGYRTPFWLSDKLQIGQKEYSKSGKVIAEIIDIDNYERGGEEAEVYLTVKVITKYQKRLHQHFFKNKPLDLGSAIEISPDQNIVYGQIVDNDVTAEGYRNKEFTVTARGRGLSQYIIDSIRIGEIMKNRYHDETIATIVDFYTEKTTKVYVSDVASKYQYLSFETNPNTQDAIVKFKIKASQIDDRWYFAGHQHIKKGSDLYFYGQDVNLFLEIEDVE